MGRAQGLHPGVLPNDRAEDALQVTDAKKIARYTPLRDRMVQFLPGWTIEIQSFVMGIRGSYLPEIWTANLAEFGLKEKKLLFYLNFISLELEMRCVNHLQIIL